MADTQPGKPVTRQRRSTGPSTLAGTKSASAARKNAEATKRSASRAKIAKKAKPANKANGTGKAIGASKKKSLKSTPTPEIATKKKTAGASAKAKKRQVRAVPAAATPAPPENAPATPSKAEPVAQTAPPASALPLPDFDALASNMPRILTETSRALSAALTSQQSSEGNPDLLEHAADAVKTLGSITEYWMSDPDRAVRAQQSLYGPLVALWGHTWRRLNGEESEPVCKPDPADRRFSDPMWYDNPADDFLRQAYVIASDWATNMAAEARGVDPFERAKAQFYVRQITAALSPSNFLATNPELLRKTLEENGENLVRGLTMMAEDVEAGRGHLKIRQTDTSKFQLGVNMAMSPGKVIFRNDLIELIQYAPATSEVCKRPLLIVPPWIYKFYVLDLNPQKSFIKYCVENGLTVFLVSWVNPDDRHADKDFGDYMREGILASLDAIEQATGERDVSAIGYCVGGTLLAITLAHMALSGDDRISSATLFTTQVDFTDAGDLRLFVDATRIKAIEERMRQTGYLEGAKMAAAFNMLRPTELIWNYFVNNYLKGSEPMPFDLLAWNSDSTRMPAGNHSFYLRNCYLDNTLTKGEMKIDGKTLDLSKVKIPVYNLAAREDHIAPPRSVFNGAKYFGGPMRYVLAGSGHIAGVVNPASKPKYQYWTGPAPSGEFDDWVANADEHPGTWWLDWIEWIRSQAPEKVPARTPGAGKLPALCDAPGTYVLEKS